MSKVLILTVAMFGAANAYCPNGCSGHGTCNNAQGMKDLGGAILVEVVRRSPALLDAKRLADADAERHAKPEPWRKLRDLLDRRAIVTREERVEVLLNQEAS